MTRVTVPDDYEGGMVATPNGRMLKIRREGGQRYIGAPEQVAPALRAHLNGDDDATRRDGTLRVDAYDDAGTCQVEKADGEVCGRELPCAYHSDDEEGS